jgi:hypothetical protein
MRLLRGGCRRGVCAEVLAYLYPKSVKKWLSTMYLMITPVWSLTYQTIRSTPLRYWERFCCVSEIIIIDQDLSQGGGQDHLRGGGFPPLHPPKKTWGS